MINNNKKEKGRCSKAYLLLLSLMLAALFDGSSGIECADRARPHAGGGRTRPVISFLLSLILPDDFRLSDEQLSRRNLLVRLFLAPKQVRLAPAAHQSHVNAAGRASARAQSDDGPPPHHFPVLSNRFLSPLALTFQNCWNGSYTVTLFLPCREFPPRRS